MAVAANSAGKGEFRRTSLPANLVAFCRGVALACGAACLAGFGVLLVVLPTSWPILLAWFGTILLMAWGYQGDLKRKAPVDEPFWYLVVVAAAIWIVSLAEVRVLFPALRYVDFPGIPEYLAPLDPLIILFLTALLLFRLTLERSLWQSTRLVAFSWAVAVFVGFVFLTGAMYLRHTFSLDRGPGVKRLLNFMTDIF